MRVVTTRDGSAAQALAAVREDANTLAVVPADAVDTRVRVLTVDGRHPLREPGRYPLTTPSATPLPEVTTLTAVGDVMLGRRVAQASGGDPARPLRPLAKRLASAEITVGNFESTLSTNGRPTQGGDSFAADPDVGGGLKLAGFDLLSLANNHVGDYGNAAMRTTFDRFEDLQIATVGAGRNLDQARRPVVITRNGVKVGFIGVDSIGETPAATSRQPGTNRLNMPPRTGPLNREQLDRIVSDIRRLDRQVDTVVVMTHWGTQYTHRPEASQRTAAKAFAEAGADVILGGHPHWVQGWEMAGSTVVIHSLGNFVFDMDFQVKTNEGVFVEIVLWDGKVKAVEPVPYVIDGSFVPRAVGGARARSILDDVWSTSRGPFNRS